jgi:hypothetical protein
MLPLGKLHVKNAVQGETWVPTQDLLWDQGKRGKTLIELAGRRTFPCKLTYSQQSDIKYASHDICPYLSVVLLKNFYKLFLKIFVSACNLDKHQIVYNTCGRGVHIRVCTNMRANIHISVIVILWLSVNMGIYCSLKEIGCYKRFVAHPITKIMIHSSVRLIFPPYFQA